MNKFSLKVNSYYTITNCVEVSLYQIIAEWITDKS